MSPISWENHVKNDSFPIHVDGFPYIKEETIISLNNKNTKKLVKTLCVGLIIRNIEKRGSYHNLQRTLIV